VSNNQPLSHFRGQGENKKKGGVTVKKYYISKIYLIIRRE